MVRKNNNEDYFASLDESDDLDSLLVSRSKILRHNSRIIPKRTISTDGIYGELFLDFYLRIVKERKAILTYANKRSFNSNYETTGPDNLVYYIDSNGIINLCICEAKFVSGATNAKKCLIEDIIGDGKKEGHITKQYLNDYFQFVVEKGANIAENDKHSFEKFLSDLNKECDAGNDFLSIIKSNNVCVNFIFFAIFDSMKKKPDELNVHYNEIYESLEKNIVKLGIKYYKIEIVFVPTTNSTMTIKEEMEKAYE